MNRACFPKEKTPEFTKMGEIHENFSSWPFLWFGLPGATPEKDIVTSLLTEKHSEIDKHLSICLSVTEPWHERMLPIATGLTSMP